MKKIHSVIRWCQEALEEITPRPEFETRLFIEKLLEISPKDLILNPTIEISEEAFEKLKKQVELRKNGRPIQYLIGKWEFMGLPFIVNPSVLIPRSDTECLVEEVINQYKTQGEVSILDVGTGSGAIAVSLAYYLEESQVTAVDISEDALLTAKENAKLNHVSEKIHFIQSDLYNNVDSKEKYDCIVSNPPYIPEDEIEKLQVEVKGYEPRLALSGGKDGFDYYRKIISQASKHLKDGGYLFLEAGDNQSEKLAKLMKDTFVDITIKTDLQGLERLVYGKLK